MTTFITDSTDITQIHCSSRLNLKQRSELGQFLTPAPIARFLANQFSNLSGHISLLDPGAGVGMLTAAFVEQLLAKSQNVESCFMTVYEVEASFLAPLEQCLLECCSSLKKHGIQADYCLHHQSFIEASAEIALPLLATSRSYFTHTILNPPYRKINSKSLEKKILLSLGIDTVNLYSAFVWLAMLHLAEGGEMAAITPRSFCNGTYFRTFRKAFLKEMSLNKIHLFESRLEAFSDDSILQENVIFHAIKTAEKPEFIEVTNNIKDEMKEFSEIRFVPYSEVVEERDSDNIIHIVTNSLENFLKVQMEKFPSTLEELGVEVSTGPVVDFRLKSALRNCLGDRDVPLFYPESVKAGKVYFPPTKPRKPIAIEKNEETSKWLVHPGWYVLVKRFSAKEEKRRIIAAVCPPINAPAIGIENHLNYYHANGIGMNVHLAQGLTAFLNSTLFDNYFRQFSGHTQVNATDLRRIRYPCKEDLMQLGEKIGDAVFDQDQVDALVHQILPIMSKVTAVVKNNKRVNEALDILKTITAPRKQQNIRSALCLLALADIQTETLWNQSTDPKLGITQMMQWFKQFYGVEYKPNSRESIRKESIQPFVQMGLVIENPDQSDRAVNSQDYCYKLSAPALRLLKNYGASSWENSIEEYRASVENFLLEKDRNLPFIPVTLPDGRSIQLSSGGQNQLIKSIVENFCPRFTPGGIVLYIGDAGDKFVINEAQKMKEMGLELDPHGKMPDLVVHYQQQDWLVLVEAVTSHGPISLKRRNELRQIFQSSSKGLVFVTAFTSRREMTRYLAEISWETEVWVADQPEHMIHFDGERFLGPYEDGEHPTFKI
ncbi:BsuBI/PstI family type II restriction endonuclease [Merismopedia glauca]|uniref:site-specific DNA-methyltransferase (adenine-specific) n=2 Tax=Merismopedia TaxID=53402 RepID=A0A2T1C376_9CYAN|nr:BsuBI/PstI family type II restriction endonuclease [Merismopedia glauca]PSB02597.1 restriction endonuclease [Merismopedia glauca CCAP 1448/3]